MEEVKALLRLENTYASISREAPEEPYILTPIEEQQVIDHAIISAKKHYAWKLCDRMEGLGIPEGDVLRRIAQVD